MRHMHQVKGVNPFAFTIFLSLWCSPANMPASHAGDHRSEAGQGRHLLGACFTGNRRPTWLRTRQPWTCKSTRADHFLCPKALSAMRLLGKQVSLVQFRVGAPFP